MYRLTVTEVMHYAQQIDRRSYAAFDGVYIFFPGD